MSKFTVKLLLTAFLVSSLLLSLPSLGDSQARIVRLSDVQGDVQIDRNTGQGFEKAFLNLPIVQGAKLQTKKDARAEVEFEDGSTLRITPETVIDFARLSFRDSGMKVTTVHLQEGTAYVNFAGRRMTSCSLTFGRQSSACASGSSAHRNGSHRSHRGRIQG